MDTIYTFNLSGKQLTDDDISAFNGLLEKEISPHRKKRTKVLLISFLLLIALTLMVKTIESSSLFGWFVLAPFYSLFAAVLVSGSKAIKDLKELQLSLYTPLSEEQELSLNKLKELDEVVRNYFTSLNRDPLLFEYQLALKSSN